MIDAKELRIGNLVYRDKRKEPVQMILAYFSHLHRLDPIPITEQSLLDLGCEKEGKIYYCWPLKFRFYKKGGYNFYVFNHKNDFIKQRLKYIHQLQNLYFALIGEELKLVE